MQKIWVQFWGWEDPLKKKVATHSSILAWRIPWAEELGRLQSKGLQESDMTYGLNHHHYEFITIFHILINHLIILKMVKVLSGKISIKTLSLLLKFYTKMFPGGEHGNPLQHSCLENLHRQRSLKGYSPWGCKELDMTEQLSTY